MPDLSSDFQFGNGCYRCVATDATSRSYRCVATDATIRSPLPQLSRQDLNLRVSRSKRDALPDLATTYLFKTCALWDASKMLKSPFWNICSGSIAFEQGIRIISYFLVFPLKSSIPSIIKFHCINCVCRDQGRSCLSLIILYQIAVVPAHRAGCNIPTGYQSFLWAKGQGHRNGRKLTVRCIRCVAGCQRMMSSKYHLIPNHRFGLPCNGYCPAGDLVVGRRGIS